MNEKTKVYAKKGIFDNEPYCPSCGKELIPLRNVEGKYKDLIIGCLDCRPCYCLKEKEIYLVDKLWFGVKIAGEDWKNRLEIVKVKTVEDLLLAAKKEAKNGRENEVF